jgi:transcription termination/antitermination protein NusA
VIVDDTQLSLAIGKKGQNVRLAAKLLEWKIDIKSEEEKRQEVEQQMQGVGGPATAIEQVSELGEQIIQKLVAAGITTVEALADMTPEQLEEIPGIGEKTLEKISVAVRHYFGQYEEGEERPAVKALAPDDAAAEAAEAAEKVELSQEDREAEAAEAASNASLDEEEAALRLDLTEEGEGPINDDETGDEGSGLIDDEMAEEQLGEITETGEGADDDGAEPVEPGHHDVSHRLVETAVTEDVAESAELQEEDDRNSGNGA